MTITTSLIALVQCRRNLKQFFLVIPESPSCCCFETKDQAKPVPYCQQQHPLLWICSVVLVCSSLEESSTSCTSLEESWYFLPSKTGVRGRKQFHVLMIGNFLVALGKAQN